MIKTTLIGFLGKDCQVNNTNGKTVMNFNVAHTEKWKDSQTGQQQQKTLWVQCAYWSDKTAVAQYLKQGTQVYVEGIPDVRTYTDQSGQTHASLTLRVLQVQLLGSAQQQSTQPAQASAPAQQAAPAADDTPF